MLEMAQGLAKRFPDYASKAPKFTVPGLMVRIIALFDRDIRDNIGELNMFKTIDASEAIALLGHDLISVDDAADATMQSLIAQKLL